MSLTSGHLKIFYCGEVVDLVCFDADQKAMEIYVPAENYESFNNVLSEYYRGNLLLQTTKRRRYSRIKEFSGTFTVSDITVTPYLCDHSATDSYILRFSAAGKSILYTGDFRGHGRKSFSALLKRLPQSDILICEHTNNSRICQWSESKLQTKFEELMRGQRNIYIFVGATNIDRIVTVYKACRKMGRILLIDPTQARILNAVGGSIPRPRSHKGIKIVKLTALKQSADTASPFVMLIRASMTDKIGRASCRERV